MLSRRAFLGGGAALLLWPGAVRAAATRLGLPAETLRALETSQFVYVSPLRSDGSESTCHGEVWYGWIDGGVHLTTARSTWKARAVARGLDRARIWVGDHGRWKGVLWNNEAFQKAPSFEARAKPVDGAGIEALLAIYRRKYPKEIGAWADRMRQGHADGSRVLIRYEPT